MKLLLTFENSYAVDVVVFTVDNFLFFTRILCFKSCRCRENTLHCYSLRLWYWNVLYLRRRKLLPAQISVNVVCKKHVTKCLLHVLNHLHLKKTHTYTYIIMKIFAKWVHWRNLKLKFCDWMFSTMGITKVNNNKKKTSPMVLYDVTKYTVPKISQYFWPAVLYCSGSPERE